MNSVSEAQTRFDVKESVRSHRELICLDKFLECLLFNSVSEVELLKARLE